MYGSQQQPQPNMYPMPQSNNFQTSYVTVDTWTILAPNDDALVGIKDSIVNNETAIELFLSSHIIRSTRAIYTDHDDSTFQNGQSYSTLNPAFVLVANVQQNPNWPSTSE